ncbi:methyltransferase [alpha proteobacterium AAP81b]|nr:methyltransferase [alpha proteobacterium AAP81b]
MDLKEEHLLGDQVNSHWYYQAKLDALTAMVKGVPATEILDIGAGSGYFSKALLTRTAATRATCVDLGYPADRDETVAGKPIAFRTSLDRSAADLVLMMDVIEHVEDDVGLVADYVGKVAAGTRFVVTVPAFMWLWSGHDVFLEHYRRYTLAGIEAVLAKAGLTIEKGAYFYGAVLPLVAGVRLAKQLTAPNAAPESDMRRYSPLVNSLLYGVCKAEVAVMGLNRLGGTSALVRAVKR